MYGIFVNENGGVHYAQAIVQGVKRVETRHKNMLNKLNGCRVAIVRTRRGKKPMILGYVNIDAIDWYSQEIANSEKMRKFTLIPEGSQYDARKDGVYFYWLSHPEECAPYPLPADAVRHGRSWCEF